MLQWKKTGEFKIPSLHFIAARQFSTHELSNGQQHIFGAQSLAATGFIHYIVNIYIKKKFKHVYLKLLF